jgi:hypothetical protein
MIAYDLCPYVWMTERFFGGCWLTQKQGFEVGRAGSTKDRKVRRTLRNTNPLSTTGSGATCSSLL